MVAAYPLLAGFETEPRKILDLVFSTYLLSDASQSNVFKYEVISLPKRVQEFDGNEYTLIDAVKSDLEAVLNRYFDSVDVKTAFKSIDDTPDNTVHVYISIRVSRDGNMYDLIKAVSVDSSKTFKVIQALNN